MDRNALPISHELQDVCVWFFGLSGFIAFCVGYFLPIKPINIFDIPSHISAGILGILIARWESKRFPHAERTFLYIVFVITISMCTYFNTWFSLISVGSGLVFYFLVIFLFDVIGAKLSTSH